MKTAEYAQYAAGRALQGETVIGGPGTRQAGAFREGRQLPTIYVDNSVQNWPASRISCGLALEPAEIGQVGQYFLFI